MRKIDEINTPGTCLNSAEDDEPIFVLKSTDPIAPIIVRLWANIREPAGVTRPEKIDEAHKLADMMEAWQREHPDKVKNLSVYEKLLNDAHSGGMHIVFGKRPPDAESPA